MKLQKLCYRLLRAKEQEEEAKQKRLKCEDDLLAAIKPSKIEGTTTVIDSGYKIVATEKLNRTLDYEAYLSLDLPENLQFVDFKPEINLKRLRAIEMVDPSIPPLCVSSKPSKTSIKITEV